MLARGVGYTATLDATRWNLMAEDIRMQVLQRIDIFTDAGLKAQLAQHLEPIVADAGRELVDAINDHVGQLVRSYVAEAIEPHLKAGDAVKREQKQAEELSAQ